MHALFGHDISLPLIEMLIEGLKELASSSKDTKTLLEELENEENLEYENFLKKPLNGREEWQIDKTYGTALDSEELMEMWFRGPSICRTSLLPSETRYLGISENSEKTGG